MSAEGCVELAILKDLRELLPRDDTIAVLIEATERFLVAHVWEAGAEASSERRDQVRETQ